MDNKQNDFVTTKQVDNVVLTDKYIKKIINTKFIKLSLKNIYEDTENKIFEQKWIPFMYKNIKAYYNTILQYAIPVSKNYNSELKKIMDKSVVKLSKKTVMMIFDESLPSEIVKGIKASRKYRNEHLIAFGDNSYSFEDKNFLDMYYPNRIYMNIISVPINEFKKNILSLDYEIINNDVYNKAVKLLKRRHIADLSEKEIYEMAKIFSLNINAIENETVEKIMKNIVLNSNEMDLYIEELLACDTNRVELERYDKKCLEDVNLGHWELWDNNQINEKQIKAKIKKNLIARNPIADIHENGLIGIDFGTKSTIVSKMDGSNKVNLMRIGIGQLSKMAKMHHYENPTIMEFINLEKFIDDYKSSNGRPHTSINDLTVSHKANNNLNECSESDFFYSYFYDIKQWCGDEDRKIKIIDQKGKERLLPSFTDLKECEFNPLEIYAYYLGLYINNMRNGIYLDYVLSFPVTYRKTVKEKILDSFTDGLKKSLPETILNDENIMKKFRVRQGVSEPAAYAITALQGYGFEPDEEDKIFYSVFDFGGGTTDFDFGVWRCAGNNREEKRYDYVINHFGSEGDMFLGGENLLELMAYEVFKANAKFLQPGAKMKELEGEKTVGFSFSKPKECESFAGSETLIANSQEAKRNTKQLMEVLRPFWEGIIEYEKSVDNKNDKVKNACKSKIQGNVSETLSEGYITYNGYKFIESNIIKSISVNGELTVDLFDKNGNRQSGQKLYVKNDKEGINVNLIEILEKRIDRGVENFFSSIVLAFRNDTALNSGTNNINIFLAGNSSKSPILRKCFEKHIKETNESIKKEKGTDGNHFILYPALGTDEAIKIQKKNGIIIREEIDAPTGKTGVAYGLIAGREGGKIKVISETTADNETKFKYNLGIEKRNMFKKIIDRNDVEYGKWESFIDAGVEDFEIYYTSLPNANKMPITDVGIYNCRFRLPKVDDKADVYIRAVSPNEIEYAVSTGEEPAENADIIRKKLGS